MISMQQFKDKLQSASNMRKVSARIAEQAEEVEANAYKLAGILIVKDDNGEIKYKGDKAVGLWLNPILALEAQLMAMSNRYAA